VGLLVVGMVCAFILFLVRKEVREDRTCYPYRKVISFSEGDGVYVVCSYDGGPIVRRVP
jgi:hypothetical protein